MSFPDELLPAVVAALAALTVYILDIIRSMR